VSLRFRVTLLTAALIAFTSTIIGFATYVTVSSVQLEQLDTSLQSALGIEGFLPGNPNRPLKPGDANDFPIPVAIAKVDARGEITWIRPSGSPRNPDPFPAIPANLLAPGADTFVSFVDPETNQSYRTASRNFPRGGSLIALTSLNDYQNSLNLIAWRTLLSSLHHRFLVGSSPGSRFDDHLSPCAKWCVLPEQSRLEIGTSECPKEPKELNWVFSVAR